MIYDPNRPTNGNGEEEPETSEPETEDTDEGSDDEIQTEDQD